MKNLRKVTAIGLAAVLSMGGLAACGNKPAEPQKTDAPAQKTDADPVKTEKQGESTEAPANDDVVTLKWYMSINPIAADTDKVIEKLNEYTREKIGVEIDYQVIANPDYK